MEIYQPEDDSYLLSEVLKKEIPRTLAKKENIRFLEIGCGSGIQLETAIKQGIKKENIFACDINTRSVGHCKKLGFNCIKSDLFEKIKGKFDMIVFNPPYLPKDDKEPLNSRIATTGGKNGGEIINRFLKHAKNHLNKNGEILLLISSLTKEIDFSGYKKKILEKKKLFFEELSVSRLRVRND